MQKAAQQFTETGSHQNEEDGSTVAARQLQQLAEDWLADCQIRYHSPRTIELRRVLIGRLLWFLQDRGFSKCGRREMRAFFAYLSKPHQSTEGRWNKGQGSQWVGALRPSTVDTYFQHLRTFFSWLVGEDFINVQAKVVKAQGGLLALVGSRHWRGRLRLLQCNSGQSRHDQPTCKKGC
jgi:hypothetical protein